MEVVIDHRLSLALRLVDTTTGRTVLDRNTVLRRDGRLVHPMHKADGTLIFLGGARQNFKLEVHCAGFRPRQLEVDYAVLDERLPLLELHLIPGPDYRQPFPCLTLKGTLKDITALDAVRAGESPCLVREVDPRRRLLTIFNPHKLELDRVWYALVDPDQEVYEPFSVVRRISEQVYKIDRPLETEFKNYFPICPLVFGGVGPGDAYCLRVRDDGAAARWMVRYEREGKTAFRTVDFRSESQPALP